MQTLNVKLEDIDNVQFDGIDHADYPDFCDAYIASCDINGVEASEDELDFINENLLGEFHNEIVETAVT